MGRKKIDKNSIEYLSTHLFHKNDIVGFQFTAGRTPLDIKEKRQMDMSCSLNKNRDSVVIDCSETDLRNKIEEEIFGMKDFPVSLEKVRDFQKQFRKLGYEVEEQPNFVGEWYWFRIKCKFNEIPYHVGILKEKLNIN